MSSGLLLPLPTLEVVSRRCTKCLVEKPLSCFSKHPIGKYGVRPACRECTALYRRENYARLRAGVLDWEERNKDRVRASKRAWNAANRDKLRESRKKWRESNTDLARLIACNDAHRRRNWKLGRDGSGYTQTWRVQARIALYGGRCYYCGGDGKTLDHRIPLARGGSHLPANLVPCCKSCNSRKHTMTEREFRARLVCGFSSDG